MLTSLLDNPVYGVCGKRKSYLAQCSVPNTPLAHTDLKALTSQAERAQIGTRHKEGVYVTPNEN